MSLCRTCLKNTMPDDLVPLFGGLLPHKIEVISSVKVVEDDNLPSMVCEKCARNINAAFNFRLVIISSNLMLQCDNYTDTQAQTTENKRVPVKFKSEPIDNDDATLDSINDKELQQEVHGDNGKIEMHEDDNLVAATQYKCKHCDYIAKNYKVLCYHRSTRHLSELAICSICGKSMLPQNMKKHMLSHYGPSVTCKICGFVSKNSVAINSHMMYHRGQKRICHICGKVYTHSSKYALHLRLHTTPKEKKHKCHLCEKAFSDKEMLNKHIRSHTGERPFICEFCKKGFSSPYALKTHRRQHTNERPYACTLCPMAFPQKVSLRTHMKSKHSSEQQM